MNKKRGSNNVDTPEMVKHCLNCGFDDCWDCLGKKNLYSNNLKLELSKKEREKLAKRIRKKAEEAERERLRLRSGEA